MAVLKIIKEENEVMELSIANGLFYILTLNDIELLKEEHYDNVNFAEIRKVLQPTIDRMTPYKVYSLKNGCFSNKFEFNTSMVTDVDIAENLWKIN